MIQAIFIFFLSGILTTFVGYWVHWSFHQMWSKWFYTAHMNHHQIQYPPLDFLSKTYRGTGEYKTMGYFAVAFSPIIAIIGMLGFLGILSWWTCLAIFAFMIFWGLVHSFLHDEFHILDSKLKTFPFFKKWADLHYLHHIDMNANFGIFSFIWDKLFKTFEDHSR